MNKNLGLAALAAGLVCGAAGQLLAVSPSHRQSFDISELARVNTQAPPEAIITPLYMKDAVAFVRPPRVERGQPKGSSGIRSSAEPRDLESTSLAVNSAIGEPVSTCE